MRENRTRPTPSRPTPTGRALTVAATFLLLACGPPPGSADGTAAADQAPDPGPLPACEWCGTGEAPDDLTWSTRIAPEGEPGEPLVLTGTVYAEDGETPMPGVVIYAYHTDAEGIYRKEGGETGNGQRHGVLRGWVETGDDGRYRFDTIRPASYPDSTISQHVHMTVLPPAGEERWIDSVKFTDDPLLSDRERNRSQNHGGPGIVTPRRDEDGTWHAERDIILDGEV